MKRNAPQLIVGVLTGFLIASTASAQSGLSQAVLALDNAPPGDVRNVGGNLFGAGVTARIIDGNRNGADFAGNDQIEFLIARGAERLEFVSDDHSRAAFEAWARANAPQLLRIIFPSSLSSATLGRDSTQLYSQQLLLSTILDIDLPREPGSPRRSTAGGLVEFEWFGPTDSQVEGGGTAWQGMYALGKFVSVQGRYARQSQSLSTNAWAASVDYHPYREYEGPVVLRVGASARTGFLYSHSSSPTQSANGFDLGTIDVGGGGWASVRKDFNRFRVGGGSLLQAAKSVAPFSGDDSLGIMATLINERGVSWNVAYGGTVAYDTTRSAAIIGKYLESRYVDANFDQPPLKLGLIGYSFALGPGTALDAGYKITSSGGVRSGAVFLQGNFGW